MSKRRPIEAKTALGISVGDIVRTSYKTGPYRVAYLSDPKRYSDGGGFLGLSIWPYPVISITCVDPDFDFSRTPQDHDLRWLNDIHREGDRYFGVHGSEIYVKKATDAPALQVGLFATGTDDDPEPYPFQGGVDYDREGEIWHCQHCGSDFNAVKTEAHNPLHCKWVSRAIYMLGGPGDTRNSLQRYLGFNRKDMHDDNPN